MINTKREILAVKFADCMARLKNFGLKGEVTVTSKMVMVSTSDKSSASCFRKAIKKSCEGTGAVNTETRPKKGFYVFTIVV